MCSFLELITFGTFWVGTLWYYKHMVIFTWCYFCKIDILSITRICFLKDSWTKSENDCNLVSFSTWSNRLAKIKTSAYFISGIFARSNWILISISNITFNYLLLHKNNTTLKYYMPMLFDDDHLPEETRMVSEQERNTLSISQRAEQLLF